MSEPRDELPDLRPEAPERIESTFRNGSLTAISVGLGFSLTFLNRWAAQPGPWHATDLVAVGLLAFGIACQIVTLAAMLSVDSLLLRNYRRAVLFFMIGLTLVALGVCLAIVGDLLGHGQRVLGG